MRIGILFVFLENFLLIDFICMKYIFTKVFVGLLLLMGIMNTDAYSAENLLITEIQVLDADSTFLYGYLYNGSGDKVLETKYYKAGTDWIRKSQKEWVYSGNKCVSHKERVWVNNEWLVNYIIDFDYPNGILTTEVHSSLQNGIMSPFRKVNYDYPQSTIFLKSEFFLRNASWELSEVTSYTKFPNGNVQTLITSSYSLGAIQSSYQSTFTYNSNGNIATQLTQLKEGNGLWINYQLINWYYSPSASSLVTSLRTKKWDTGLQQWIHSQRTDYDYNASNQIVYETNQYWKDMFWGVDVRYENEYDGSGRLVNKKLYMPIYNELRSTISIHYSNFTADRANLMESKYNFWGGTTGELTASYIPYLFNSELVIQKAKQLSISYIPSVDTGISTNFNDKSVNWISVYPNPSEGMYYVDIHRYNLNSWTISDLKGQVMKYHTQAPASGIIDITDLPKGVYILKAITADAHLTQRLIKK